MEDEKTAETAAYKRFCERFAYSVKPGVDDLQLDVRKYARRVTADVGIYIDLMYKEKFNIYDAKTIYYTDLISSNPDLTGKTCSDFDVYLGCLSFIIFENPGNKEQIISQLMEAIQDGLVYGTKEDVFLT